MNTIEIAHPSHEDLAAFISGRLGVVASAEIERHLADCDPCCQLLKSLPNDTLISLLGPQSDTKAQAASSVSAEPRDPPRPQLDATIAPGTYRTHIETKPSSVPSSDIPAELQGHPRYRIVALLGRGGMGSVYQAEHRLMNRPVALKVIDRHLVQTPGLVERFHREVQAAAKLAHPNIVTAYDAEQAGELHYLVMELVEGTDLGEVVRQRGKLPIEEACEYVRQAAQGLQHASERGMVHRDIKPQNLMLTPDGQVKILDFGLAHFATEIAETSGLTQVGAMMGTPDYMAPEQARDAHCADIRADIYSLGCTLYCLLSGGAPFPQGSIVEKIMAHVERQPAPLRDLRADIPSGLTALLARMMAKSPGDRFQTPTEVADALGPFASPKARPQKPRSPARIATAVLAVFTLFALCGITVVLTNQGRIEIQSEVDDVDLVVKQGGKEIAVIDAQTGSIIKWLPTGKYDIELKDKRNDIAIHNDGFTLTRWGKEIVTLKRKAAGPTVSGVPSMAADREGAGSNDAPPSAIAPFDGNQANKHQEAWAKHLNVPVEYTNSIGMKFRLIPPGEFMMGSTVDEIEEALKLATEDIVDAPNHWRQTIKSETPLHKVILTQPIYLGVDEVRQKDYEAVMGGNPSHHAATGAGKEAVADLDTSAHPVEMVSWNDAVEFCVKLSQREKLEACYFRAGEMVTLLEGAGYRLPTEAQWEFACRAGTSTKYWTGDKDEDLARAGWMGANSGGRTHAAGELKSNPFGLYDMPGNVWEWIQDGWEPTYYEQFPERAAIDPGGGSAADSPRVLRGGGWGWHASNSRSSHRHNFSPLGRHNNTGFRVALPVDAVKEAIQAQDANPARTSAGWKGWPQDAAPAAVAPFDATTAKGHQDTWAKHLGMPVEYTNSIGMKFRLIPPGEFSMGSTPENVDSVSKAIKEYFPNESENWEEFLQGELPPHKVILTQPFFLGVHEVTQAQYEKVMGQNPSHFAATGGGNAAVNGLDTTGFPVEMVSWHDAGDFCTKLSQQELLGPSTALNAAGYRLPTEAEWEMACRAGTTTRFSFGEQFQDLAKSGWFGENCAGRTHTVGELKPNPFGLYDLHGNVGEWVQDRFEPDYYAGFQDKPAIDPTGPSAGTRRVLRGGFWHSTWIPCQSSSRIADDPLNRIFHMGFRLALSVDEVQRLIAEPSAATTDVKE